MAEHENAELLWQLLDRLAAGLMAAVALASDPDECEPPEDADDVLSDGLAALRRVERLRMEREGQGSLAL